jgi:hypothetical protein
MPLRVGQGRRCHRLPAAPAVARPAPGNDPLPGAAKDLQPPIGVRQDARLDRGELAPRIERSQPLPAGALVRRTLEMHAPAQMFGAGRAKEGQAHRLVLDRPEDAPRQPPRGGPSAPAICRGAQRAQPAARARPFLVEQQERPGSVLMQHRVPARLRPAEAVHAARHLDRGGPAPLDFARQPDPDLARAPHRAHRTRRQPDPRSSRRWSRRVRRQTARPRK